MSDNLSLTGEREAVEPVARLSVEDIRDGVYRGIIKAMLVVSGCALALGAIVFVGILIGNHH